MDIRRHLLPAPARHALAVAGALTLVSASLVACGDDATVDNSAKSTTVPSVSGSAAKSSGKSASKSADPSADKTADASASPSSTSAPQSSGGGQSAQDGGVEKVSEVPTGAQRSKEDKAFLDKLKGKNIDVSKLKDANAIGGIEDQLIAAGRAHCDSKQNNKNDIYTPLAAGQLVSQGILQGDPKAVEGTIRDAAQASYCP